MLIDGTNWVEFQEANRSTASQSRNALESLKKPPTSLREAPMMGLKKTVAQ